MQATDLLQYIDPSLLTYQEWVNVGMALKDEGCSPSVWDEWSRKDRRYHAGECEKKWQSFNGNAEPVTAGTIYHYAVMQGYRPASSGMEVYDWDDPISADDERIVHIDNKMEIQPITEPAEWHPGRELITYLETLFDANDNVGFVTEVYKKDDNGKVKYLPKAGCCSKTAGELIAEINRYGDDLGAVIGDTNPEAGAWIRFNPLDGKGVRNENVTEYRYALVESDTADLSVQNTIIRELELPVAALVYSGGKSLHAIVRVDAPNYEEYRKRVDHLYEICSKNGLEIDRQNRNPSRLSRMPGVMRNGMKQYLIASNIGKKTYDEWREWIDGVNDDLPDVENLASQWDELPKLADPLIDGVLRQGHKMLLAGPSKAGKSFALIELSIAIAEGTEWFSFKCAKGRVLYVNLELDPASCLHRFRDVYRTLGLRGDNAGSIDIWELRGRSVPMDKLAPKLIRRAKKGDYAAVIIDPIYKVITGDENSADQMAHFCNQFDKVCSEAKCAVIYCHHHSKGFQGGKRSMDRASGSGVFARDPDAFLDLTELIVTDALKKTEENALVCAKCLEWIMRFKPDFPQTISQDDMQSAPRMREHAMQQLQSNSYSLMCEEIDRDVQRINRRTAWRLEGTLREFPSFEPVNTWFEYPVHTADKNGVLRDLTFEEPSWQKNLKNQNTTPEERKEERSKDFEDAFGQLMDEDGKCEISELATHLGVSKKTIINRLKEHGGFWTAGNVCGKKAK